MQDKKNEFEIAMEMGDIEIEGAEIFVGDADEEETKQILNEISIKSKNEQ